MADIIKTATREAYGKALVELGGINDKLIVLDADLAAATKTGMFKKAFPDRFIDCGIAEANMICTAAGLSTTGYTVFASSFAMFAAGRAFEQVRNSIGYPHLNVKIGATHAGISVGEDGASHQCCEDIALMRTIPGMTIINPADDIEARSAVFAAAEYVGPVYMRFGRLAVPRLFDESYKFEIGKGTYLKEGKDVTIIATGLMVERALTAAENLKAEGIDAAVINMATIKPIDREIIINAAKSTGAIVTAEEHSIIGGLGGAVAEVICESCPVPVLRVGVEDKFGRSGPAVELLDLFGLNASNIAVKAKAAVALKKYGVLYMNERYDYAKQKYAAIGVDTDEALKKLSSVSISMHCWQGDDVGGFENSEGLSGGIQATGNYPGKAVNPKQLMDDIDAALSLVPGKHRINLHSIYAIYDGEIVSRDKLRPEHFDKWIEFAKERGLGIDINPTFFSHPLAADGLTLSHPNEKIRRFWIDHAKAVRRIAEHIGRELGTQCLNNIWIPDGYKETPADRIGPRKRLMESLDEIFAEPLDKRYVIDSVESKLFGIGVESYTVGSQEFYLNYAAKNNILCLLDNGHFHPTEVVSDKIPSMLLFADKVALHVTRGVRWDSDHVVALDDELKEIAKEIVRCNALDRVLIGLDYFDASINRIAAWVIGMRNMQKALLYALLVPGRKLADCQNAGDFTTMFALSEELKTYPYADVWDKFCEMQGAPAGEEWLSRVKEYEKNVLALR